jgi:hypothetical protein
MFWVNLPIFYPVKNALMFVFIKAYGVEQIEDWLEGVICCGCWMGKKEAKEAGNQTTEYGKLLGT